MAIINPEQKPYKKLTPFCLCMYTNFPFIEKTFDSMTNYEMLCKIVEYLNNVIYNTNTVTDNQINLCNAFVELKNYIDNFFSDLDVQEEINNKLDDMAQSGELTDLIARFLKYGYVSNYGGINNSNLTDIINNMINTFNIKYIICDVDGAIDNINIKQNQQIIINFQGHTITFNNKVAENIMFNNLGTLVLENCNFNGNNNNSMTILKGANLSKTLINNCNFLNFYEKDKTRQTHIIFTTAGSYSRILNCNFENIKQCGNGVETDYGGSASCILSQYDKNNPTNNETICVVNNCTFKNNYNVNEQGEIIVEDFDNIKFAVDTNLNEKNMFIVSNITSYNSGKRVVKAQTNNVIINNINCYCDNFQMLCIFSLFNNNHNVSNIYGKLYNASKAFECLSNENCNISNINVENIYNGEENIYNTCAIISNGKNCNFDNLNIKGFSTGITIWDNTENLKFNNCNFQSIYSSIYIYTRTSSDYNPSTGISLLNIYFNNCNFLCDGETKNSIFNISSNNDNNFIDYINFTNCNFKALKTNYLYGTFNINSLNAILENCYFIFNNNNDNIYNLVSTKTKLKLINCLFKNLNNTPKIVSSGNSRFYVDKLITNSNIQISGDSKMIIQYSSYNGISGNTEENCHIDSFNMN